MITTLWNLEIYGKIIIKLKAIKYKKIPSIIYLLKLSIKFYHQVIPLGLAFFVLPGLFSSSF